jgi:predicted TIM-barrel fold metal-dependent hydrolase
LPSYDVHQHFWPPAFIDALSQRTAPPRLRDGVLELAVEGNFAVDFADHDLGRRLELLDRHGIDVALISLAPTMEVNGQDELVDAYYTGILEIARESGGRLRPLANGECKDGFAGACVSAPALVEGVGPLLAGLEAAGQILFVHPGPPVAPPAGAPAWWTPIAEYTAQMQAAYLAWLGRDAERHTGLPVIFAILAGGAPIQLERFASRNIQVPPHPNVYFDIASYGHRALELCVAAYGVGQLVFGSDTPVLDPGPGLQALAEFGDAVVETVWRENPARLLGDKQ